jgi:HD-GYP domain-containing protein (c-di-GMP phosphodiesterase class II)
MLFVEVATGTPKTKVQLKQENKHMSLPESWTDATLEALGVARVTETVPPDVGEWQVAVKDSIEEVNGAWLQTWTVQEMFTEYTQEVTDEDGVTTTNVVTVQDQKDAKTTADLLAKRQKLIVTMRQARLALAQENKLQLIEDAIALIPDPDKTAISIEWEYASTVERLSPWIDIMASALGMTDVEMDALFELAATL